MAEEKKRPCSEKTVCIQPTTGGQIDMKVARGCTVACLKRALSKRIRVPKERIVLLHRNKQLVEGTLEGNNVVDGSKLTLLPSVETGLLTQKPELCVMQALETLNDSQVDSFLTGKSPLNLTMRLGDHMMFIQLQLSTITPAPATAANRNVPTSSTSPLPTPPTTPTSPSTPLQFPVPLPASSTPPSPPPSPKLTTPPQPMAPGDAAAPTINSSALAEASRNLTHTLKQLSSAALNKKMNESCDGRCCDSRRQGGAVIESMFHHGRGVYSGTFSGTLSPSLQDKDGRPRRDISTIIHILNDLLGASSHCRPSAQCLCTTSASGATATTTATVTTTTTTAASPTTPTTHTVGTLEVKVDGESRQDENKVLRQKVEHIQSMLEERRRKRKARRTVRTSPYPTPIIPDAAKSANSSRESKMSNFSSSETAVA